MNMQNKMRKKAIPATSTKRSNKIIKSITRGDITELNHSMKPIINQNRREYIEGLEVIYKDNSIYSSKNSIQSDIIKEGKIKILTKKL